MTLPRRRFLAMSACAIALPAAAQARHRWQGVALGADVALTVEGGDAAAARAFFAEAERSLRAIERQFSLFAGSELVRMNALGRLGHPSDDMLALLDLAGRVHEATGGVFDPTVQPLWQARRLGQDEDAGMALVGWRDLQVAPGEIRLTRPGMALTLNGIAQGFAADRLAEVAARHHLTDVLIDAGEVRGLGPRDWRARIETPDGRVVRELALRGRALATSAAMGTRIGPDGDRPHIMGPGGEGPRWAVASVSADSAALADALSTAAILMDRPAIDRALGAFPNARIEALVAL
ncbi:MULTISPECIES: FAD:protein FMN transferase [unclassified Paracoccus (in: a-proteobacteria)]|uniref:FAD:protein FMN transferase n=1 Tax=unclassified Paracoccus (in: a-proteobacteria) TaxID=2688777 RepID=UPI00160042CD|nr:MULTISPECIES: FAD:protein FMN transferase [unclassified Paracoccus (in: a-proteobacteria)]MBB1491444.1 FAD:protein FMN transferase [Paracoccus sp. MC1854]MBB1497672.1 FAD:protein FMN transferase [Paracoccus sp. MC1862]QQO44110.1 FAD:protein FMN transferase [Paracoccus sp. MC1862]